MKRLLLFLSIIIFISCSNSKNTPEFIKAVQGKYLFNSDEYIEITFVEAKMNVEWRGKKNIKPVKVNDSTFYLQDMNEKLIFKRQPKMHILLANKREHEGKTYTFEKMAEGEKTPGEYLLAKEYDKALAGYLAIQQKDSLDRTINQWKFNRLGYQFLRKNNVDEAIEVFKINTQLYPNSSNTYDSLAEGYWQKNDTVNTL